MVPVGPMTDDEDLQLNTLHRFAKHSDKLILEEHGHCEVPAGCGGVILTWRNPEIAQPLLLHVASPGRCRVAVDGERMHSGRLELAFGIRTLVFHIAEIGDGPRAFAAVTRVDLRRGYEPGPIVPGSPTRVDGSWQATTTDPAEHGQDTDWQPLTTSGEAIEIPDSHSWTYNRVTELGASVIALPADVDEVWLRRSFEVTRALARAES